MRLVVDSADIPLNVSREMVQKSPVLAAIGKADGDAPFAGTGEARRERAGEIRDRLGEFRRRHQGGPARGPERRDDIFAIARFASTKAEGKTRTLKDYVADLRENQTAIFYITGDDAKRLATSPQLEGFRARGVEVLLLDDAVDAFWVTSALGYDGKPFKSVTQGQADIDLIPLVEDAKEETPPAENVGDLVAALKETLGNSIEDVRVSTRLTESAACLIASDTGLDRQLARILAETGQKGLLGKPVLEINAKHPAVIALAASLRDKGREGAADGMYLLLDLARVADGETPLDPAAFTRRLGALLAKGV